MDIQVIGQRNRNLRFWDYTQIIVVFVISWTVGTGIFTLAINRVRMANEQEILLDTDSSKSELSAPYHVRLDVIDRKEDMVEIALTSTLTNLDPLSSPQQLLITNRIDDGWKLVELPHRESVPWRSQIFVKQLGAEDVSSGYGILDIPEAEPQVR